MPPPTHPATGRDAADRILRNLESKTLRKLERTRDLVRNEHDPDAVLKCFYLFRLIVDFDTVERLRADLHFTVHQLAELFGGARYFRIKELVAVSKVNRNYSAHPTSICVPIDELLEHHSELHEFAEDLESVFASWLSEARDQTAMFGVTFSFLQYYREHKRFKPAPVKRGTKWG